jgi:hypothetical protein
VFYRLLSLTLALASFAGLALAGDWPDEKDPVKVTVVVVLASEKGDKIDKNLKMLATEVQKTHPHLKSFSCKTQMIRSLKPDEKTSLGCVDAEIVEMIVKHGADKDNRVSLHVKPPMMSAVEYQSVCGKYLPIVTPYKTKKNGDTLILAIKLEPCQKK